VAAEQEGGLAVVPYVRVFSERQRGPQYRCLWGKATAACAMEPGVSSAGAVGSSAPALELFVPGRVCLLGEHTDWAGGFRRFNPALCAGYTVVTGTNQGIHARVRKCKGFLRLSSTDNAGERQHAEIAMDLDTLLRTAREGGHFSYIAGVAYKVSRRAGGAGGRAGKQSWETGRGWKRADLCELFVQMLLDNVIDGIEIDN
jgi:hypothetical protein